MKSIVNLRRVQTTSRRQHRVISQQRLSNRCDALCQEITQLKWKLAKEKENSASLKKVAVQLCRDSAEARDWVAQDKLLQDKLDKFNKEINDEISQSQENFKAELDEERQKNMLLQEELQKTRVSYNEISQKYTTEACNARNHVDNLLHEVENGVQQQKGPQKNFKAELDEERQKNMLLQEELQKTRVSYNEISQKYTTDANNARHELDNLLHELQYGIQQYKGLQKAYEELCTAHTVSQKNFTAELHAERQKNMLLQEELQKTCVSYNEISQKYTTEACNARNHVDNLLHEVENGVQQQKGPQKNFKAELDEERQKNMLLQEELQKTRVSYNEISQKYTTDANNARHELDNLLHELQYGVQQYKGLQKAYEELCTAHTVSQKNLTAELHAERQKNMLLQELKKTCESYNEISQRYTTDADNARHELDNLLHELQYGVQQHKGLQKDYEELCAAHKVSQKNFTAELHAERQKNMLLQEELKKTCVSYNKISQRYTTDADNARHKLDNLLHELEHGVQQHKGLQKAYEELCTAHTVSQKNFTAELHAERQKNMLLQEELQKTCVSYSGISQRHSVDIALDTDVEMECV